MTTTKYSEHCLQLLQKKVCVCPLCGRAPVCETSDMRDDRDDRWTSAGVACARDGLSVLKTQLGGIPIDDAATTWNKLAAKQDGVSRIDAGLATLKQENERLRTALEELAGWQTTAPDKVVSAAYAALAACKEKP